jgi:DNA-binding response OmpR family regulator
MPSRIIVIDDSPTSLGLTVQALAQAGFTAQGAHDLATLEAALAQGPVDLVLVDVGLTEFFGDDVVEYLRQHKGLSAKLLLYSELPEQELSARAAACGADGHLAKGAGLEALVAKVRALVGTRPPSRPKRVLVVDDSPMVAMVLQADLASKGFEVLTADSAEKATRIILRKQTRPDLILLDVRMPNVNGEQLCRFIKGNSLFAGIKVLLCSGESPDELRRICREAGADGFVSKDAVLSKVLATELNQDKTDSH